MWYLFFSKTPNWLKIVQQGKNKEHEGTGIVKQKPSDEVISSDGMACV